MKIQATKRPWSLCYVNHKCIGFGKQTQRGIATITEMVANTVFDKNVALTTKDFAISEANARLIVKAVNCHEKLVEALKDLMLCIQKENKEFSDQLQYSLDKSDKALKESEI
jgi:hypothetical protein